MDLWYSLLSACTTHSNSPCFVLSSHTNRSWIDDNFFKQCVDDIQVVIPLLSRNSKPASYLWVFDIHCSPVAPPTCPTLPLFCTTLTKSLVTVPLGELIWTLSGVDKFFLSNFHPNFKSLMSFSAMITKVSFMTLQGALHNVVKVYTCTKSDQYIFKNESFLTWGLSERWLSKNPAE